jgi:AcrR family transcriptional regulator
VGFKIKDNDSAGEKIIQAAKKEFALRGYNGARMGEIAKTAGVNKALIHYYFKSKEGLYQQVLKKSFGLGERTEIGIYADKWRLSPSQKLYVLFYLIIHLTFRGKDRDRYRILYWEIVEGNKFHELAIQNFVIPASRIIQQTIEEGIRAGEFETKDSWLLTVNTVFSIFHFNLDREIISDNPIFGELYGERSDEEVFDDLVQNLFKTLSPRNNWLSVPEVPAEIIRFLDKLIDTATSNSQEGYMEDLLWKMKEIIGE